MRGDWTRSDFFRDSESKIWDLCGGNNVPVKFCCLEFFTRSEV